MKKLIALLVGFMLLVSVFPTLGYAWGGSTISIPISAGGFQLEQIRGMSESLSFDINPNEITNFRGKLLYEGLSLTQDIGMPQIPIITERIFFQEKLPTSISVVSAEWVTTSIPELDKYSPRTWEDGTIDYPEISWDGQYPEKLGDFRVEDGSDGHWLTLVVAPVSLNFDSNEMLIFTHIDLEVNYEIDSTYSLSSVSEEDEIEKAVILCPAILRSSAESLAVVQRGDGYEVEVITVDEISSQFSPQEEEPEGFKGYDDFSKLQKEYLEAYDYELVKKIRSYFESRLDDLDYVTIMGDGELVPPSFYNYGGRTYYEFDKYVPTDLFYASPDLDTVPNFALGRLPVRNTEEAEIIVEKLINYRKALTEEGWFHKINLGGGDPFSGGFEGEIDCQALIDMGILDGFEVNKYYKTRDRFGSEDLLEAFNDEAGFVYTVSHGSGEALITEPGEITTEDILALPKRDKLPILLSPSCINGMYDSTIVDYDLDEYEAGKGMSFSQACIASPGGPIAYFGGSRLNYAGINWTIEGGVVKTLPFDEMDRFLQEIMNSYHNWSTTLGEMTVQAYKKYNGIGTMSFFGTGSKTLLAFVFFGDPTIKLPPTPGGSPHRMPEIELIDVPMRDMNYGSIKIPALSIVDSNKLEIKSDVPWMNFEILNLETDVEIVSDWKKVKPGSERLFGIDIDPKEKSFWQVRLELPNLSEVWIYYISAADHDLAVESTRDFFITEPKTREHFTFFVVNDGLKNAEDIEVDFYFDDKKIQTRKILELENGYYGSVYFKVDSPGIGDHEVRIETRFNFDDQYPEDNEFKRKLVVTEEETCKAVCLISYFFPSHKAKEYLELDEYNLKAPDFEGKPTEIALSGSDSYWALIFGYPMADLVEIGADSVIIADPFATNPFSTDSIVKLNEFDVAGGSIIGMGCLYDSTSAPLYNQMYDWFGLDPEVNVKSKEIEKSVISPVSEDSPFFDGGIQIPLEINSVSRNEPKDSTWEEMVIDDKSEIVAHSSDGKDILLVNSQNVYLSSSINVKTDDELRFLYNLVAYNMRPRLDAMISLSGIGCTPALPTVGEKIEIRVTVENVGNTDLSNLTVSIEGIKQVQKIDSIKKDEKVDVIFTINAPDKVGIFIITPRVSVDGDTDDENDSTSLRIRIREKKEKSTENIISQINLKDGDIIPLKPMLIKGKASPDAFINISGSMGRADSGGSFIIPFNPSNEQGLMVRAKTKNGSTEEFKIWPAFEQGGNIGCMLDESHFLAASNFVIKTDSLVLKIIDEISYLNIEEVAEYLGLQFEKKETSWSLSGGTVELNCDNASNVVKKSIGEWSEDVQLTDKSVTSENKLYVSLETLSKLSFSVDYDEGTSSLLLEFPKMTVSDNPIVLNSFVENTSSDEISIPSEANYGKPKVVSFGALDGEVRSLMGFQATSKKLYLWTQRGIQEWTLDGEYLTTKGFPETLAEDLDLPWSSIFHASSSYYSGMSVRFFVSSKGGLIFITSERMATYDRDWNRLSVTEFDENMNVNSTQVDNDGNLFIFDGYLNCHVFAESGEKITDFEMINSSGERINRVSNHCVTADGKLVVIETNSVSVFNFGGNGEWSVYLYDTNGDILKEKHFKKSEDEDAKEEELPVAPDYIISDRDGTFWLIEAGWSNTTVKHWDSDFEEIDSTIIDTNLRRVSGVQVNDDGKFYINGSFTKKEDSVSKQYLMLSIDKDLEENHLVPHASSDSEQRFFYPGYMTYDTDGNLLASRSREIRKYDKMGTYVDNMHFQDDKGESVDVDWFMFQKDNIYAIVDGWLESYVAVANSDYEVTKKIPLVVESTKDRDEYVLSPRNVAVDESADEMFILDRYETNAIQVVSLNSSSDEELETIEIIRSFAPKGIGEGKVSCPVYLRKFEDRLFILDASAKKIVAYDTDGNFLFEFGGEGETPGRMMAPYSMSIDENGLIWIVDGKLSKILIFDINGTYITSLGREGNLIPAGTMEGYRSDPFTLLSPYEACANSGQITIFDYCHNRIIMLNSLEDTINMNVIPENPILSLYQTQMSAYSEIVLTNTGPGILEGTVSCEDEKLEINPEDFSGNFVSIELRYNTEGMNKNDIPEFVFLAIESNVGTSNIKIPIITEKIEFTLKVGSQVASGASGITRLVNKPTKSAETYLLASSDLEVIIPLVGIKSNGGQTLFYNLDCRGLGFTVGSDIAELRVGEDTFRIHLDAVVDLLPDGSFAVPLDVITSFIGCEIVEQDDVMKVVSRN
jgi:Peptidase family C25/6-bladed beta-propeller/CARDB